MNTKTFPLRDVLTVTTGRLLTEPRGERDNGIGDLYEILNWITSDSLFTHQLPRAGDTCKPWLLERFPELKAANDMESRLDDLFSLNKTDAQGTINLWLQELRDAAPEIKDFYDIPKLPDGWATIDPLIELESMVGKERVITVAQ